MDLKTDKEFVNTLEDNIREWGAMDKLIRDCSKAEMSLRVQHILRAIFISAWYSKPYHENQYFAENGYGAIKATTNRVMNNSGAPDLHLALMIDVYLHLTEPSC